MTMMWANYRGPSDEMIRKAAGKSKDIEDVSKVIVRGTFGQLKLNLTTDFTSVMKEFEVNFDVEDQKLTSLMMAKCKTTDRPMVLWCWRLFTRECEFYSKLVPKLEEILNPIPLALPRVLHVSYCKNIILMDNLKHMGYVMKNPESGLNEEEVEAILVEMAKFHAASFHLIKTYDNNEKKEFGDDFPRISDADCTTMSPITLTDIVKEMNVLSACAFASFEVIKSITTEKDLINRFIKFFPSLHDSINAARGDDDMFFPVLCRCDSWNNNFMFKYREGEGNERIVDDVKFLDFQDVTQTRPTHDVAVLFCTSTTPELRESHQERLFRAYHKEFKKNLLFISDAYKSYYDFEYFSREYNSSFPMGFYMGMARIFMIFWNKRELEDLIRCERSDSFQVKLNRILANLGKMDDDETLKHRLLHLVKEAHERELF